MSKNKAVALVTKGVSNPANLATLRSMKTAVRFNGIWCPNFASWFSIFIFCFVPCIATGQLFAMGEIVGRVYNASSGNYLNNARVMVQGTTIETNTNDNGEYRLRNVPPGAVSIVASYVGLKASTVSLRVEGTAPIRLDFNLSLSDSSQINEATAVELEVFTVEEREMSGVAVAQHEQRYAPNIKSVVSLDEFGDMGEGNVGEFLKYVPGVDIVYSPTNPQSASIRGMPASGTLVMFDGALAASSSAGDSRTFDLATAASGNVDRLEITKTPTPDMPANAVGGSINVISKSGFSRRKPQFKYEVFGTYTELHGIDAFGRRLRRGAGSENFGKTSALKPGTNLSYLLPLSSSLAFNFAATYSTRNDDREFITPTWNRIGLVQTTNQMNNLVGGGGMQMLSGGMDWKVNATDLIRISLSRSYRPGYTRQYVVRTTAGANATGDATHFQGAATGVGTAVQAPAAYNYSRDLNRMAVSYRHEGSVWRLDGNASFSNGAWVRNDVNEGFFGGLSATLSNLVVRNEGLWGVTEGRVPVVTARNRQGASVDVFDGSLLSVASASSNQQSVESEAFNVGVNAARDFHLRVPLTVKAGLFLDRQVRERADQTRSWAFNPPNGTAGRLASHFDLIDIINSDRWYFTDTNGTRVAPQWLSVDKLFSLFESNPSWFTLNEANAHISSVNEATRLTETISAAYVRTDARLLNNRLWLVAGVRFEHTRDRGTGPLNDIWAIYARNPDGSFVRNTSGQLVQITTNALERAKLQYRKHGASSEASYDGYYPSMNASYNLTEDVVVRAAYARTIGRPDLDLIIPSTVYSDPDAEGDNRSVTIVNGKLKPWTADNFDLTLETYNIKGGVGSVSLFMKEIENFSAVDRTLATPALLEEFSLPPEFSDYEIVTRRNAGSARVSGFELAYRQSLHFLPGWARGIQVFGNLTALDLSGTNAEDFSEFSPRNINWGASFARKNVLFKLNVAQTKWVRRASVASSATTPPGSYQYRAPQTRIGLSAEYRFTRRFSVYASARNLLGEPVGNQNYNSSVPEFARPSNYQYVPAEFTLGVKGEF